MIAPPLPAAAMPSLQPAIETLRNNIALVTVAVTVTLAFLGYIATYLNARVLAKKKDRLELVTQRLNEFYGPLYVATRAGRTAYEALLRKLGQKDAIFVRGEDPSPEVLGHWVLWMTTVFMPLNEVIERIIIDKAHLIIEERMPDCLLQFVTHVVGHRAVLAQWAKGDFSEKQSPIDFPAELNEYAARSYAALKSEQVHLLKSL